MRKVLAPGAVVLALGIVACASGGGAGGGTATFGGTVARASVADLTRDWPAKSHEAATAMEQRYGPPAEVTPTHLVWNRTGPWKRTIVYNYEVPHAFPKPHTDVMEQFIDYRVPVAFYDDLAQYDGSVVVQRTNGEISARCDREAMNFLAINLAHDIVTGRRTVEQARLEYARVVQAVMDGNRENYTERLIFDPRSNTREPDRTTIPQ